MCDIMELRMQLSNIKVGTRLALSFGLVLFITALIAGIGIWRLQALAATTQQLTSTDNERLKAAQQWRQGIYQNWIRTRAALLDSGTSHLASWQAEMDQTSKDVDVSRKVVERLLQSDEGRELLAGGTDIDYDGATGVELIGPGETAGVYREVDFKGGTLNVVGFH